jgi:L-ascorbate metabolism protein UlaG (beta-lactamase superfamily)
MQRSRRWFLKLGGAGAGAALAGATWWVSTSQRRSARWARRIIEDARRTVPPAPFKPEPGKWSDNDITITWLGHATVLIGFYGIHILTDPVLGKRAGVYLGLGTAGIKRYVAPALSFPELPNIDVLLLSHAHMDHMDIASLRRFDPAIATISAPLTGDVLATARRRNVQELGWGKHTRYQGAKGELEVEAFEVKHWGQRWPSDLPRGYNGYVLRRENRALIFGGDTAATPTFKALRTKGPFAAAIMPIGAYRPWIWNHCTPEEAWEMTQMAGGTYLIPIHHRTFRLSEEPFDEPIERLQTAMQHEPSRLALREVGETFVCPRT